MGENWGEEVAYAQLDPPSAGASRAPSSDCRLLFGARVRVQLLGELCLFTPQSAQFSPAFHDFQPFTHGL
jgi:hypothetical protein